MAQVIDKIVRSKYPPRDTRVLWFDTTDDSLKSFTSKGWDKVSTKIIENITYSQLKYLRDNGKLIPGCYYRITDYQCTTSQANTRSAGHQFDIIVRADSENKLNEEASAIQHEGDEYFANSDLNAWQIWYCLDNDTSRFEWADKTNGKGVIYRMIDEWNNDIPYDFKNIIYVFKKSFMYSQWGTTYEFTRDASIDMSIDGIQYYGYTSKSIPLSWSENKCWIKEDPPTISSKVYKNDGSEISYGGLISDIILDSYEIYTFGRDEDLSKSGNCYNNSILSYYKSNILTLNKITFGSSCYNNTFGINCYNNTFGDNCYNNTFGNNCYKNIFISSCYNNSFGNNCYNNSFGASCYKNTFGSDCYSNSFGDYGYSNSFDSDCNNNFFGNNGHSNTFGSECFENSFGKGCDNNSFGNNCYRNTFGDSCYKNTFGSDCYRNTFGSNCSSNLFGKSCNNIKFASDKSSTTKYSYYQNNHFGDGCQYICFTGVETASFKIQVQNYNFAKGLKGTSSTYLTIGGKRNLAYETKVAKNSNGELKIYCEADLVQ